MLFLIIFAAVFFGILAARYAASEPDRIPRAVLRARLTLRHAFIGIGVLMLIGIMSQG
jgi:hypothetical protein